MMEKENVIVAGEKIRSLRWYDILVVTIIMFSGAIITSFQQYQALIKGTTTLTENITFDVSQNYQSLLSQGFWLILAAAYLVIRKFDFSVFLDKIKLSKWLPLQAVVIFVLSAIPMDIQYLMTYGTEVAGHVNFIDALSRIDMSLVQYSLFNGFFEEIFFLGVCLAVDKKYTKWAFLYSLIIRFSFHTYQGMSTALALGFLLGGIYFFLYKKLKPENMLPFFIAHSFADMIGLSVIFYFWP